MKSASEPVVIGIDLGGTKILSAVIASDGRVVARAKKKTRPERGQQAILDRIASCARDAVEAAEITMFDIQGVGLGSPGPLDLVRGTVIETPNLPLNDAPLVASLERDLGLPVVIDNDVNIGTLGEKVYGAGRGVDDVVGLFPGTGLGGGIIIDGRLHRGHSMNAGELGHMTVAMDGPGCGCGKKGCLEAFASRTAIVKRIRKRVENSNKGEHPIEKLVNGNWNRVTSGVLVQAIAAGDKLVPEALDEAAVALGIGIGSLCNILGPQKVILGGGVIEALGETMFDTIRKHAKENAFAINIDDVDIVPAELGDDAGILGAAALIWQALGDRPELSSRRRQRTLPVIEPITEERLVIGGAHYTYDVIITPNGDVLHRKRRLAKEVHGTGKRLALQEIKSILTRFEKRPRTLVISTVEPNEVVDEEIVQFLQGENCDLITASHAELPVTYREAPDPKAAVVILKK